jgi:hypothetical protein
MVTQEMVEKKEEIIDAEIVEELTNPNWDFEKKSKKQPQGTRKKDFPSFTPKTRLKILNATVAGLPFHVCAAEGGVTGPTLKRWLEKGQRAQERIDEGEIDELSTVEVEFAEFFMGVNQQHAKAMINPYKTVHDAATTGQSVKAAQWLLERRWPDDFGDKKKLQIDQDVNWRGRLTKTNVDNRGTAKRLSTEDLKALRESHIKLLEAGDEKKKDED